MEIFPVEIVCQNVWVSGELHFLNEKDTTHTRSNIIRITNIPSYVVK